MSYAVTPVAESVWQIMLPNPSAPPPFNAPTNVYLFGGHAPALVGTGHPHVQAALDEALASLGVARRSIRRVVALDWSPDQLGAAEAFPHADLFARSPDLCEPADYAAFAASERRWLSARVTPLLESERWGASLDGAELPQALDDYLGATLSRRAEVIPLRGGHTLALGSRRFEVREASGPYPGHIVLTELGDELMLSGRLVTDSPWGDPWVRDVSQLILTVEGVFDAARQARLLLPTVGRVETDPSWHIRRVNRHMTSLLSNLPTVLVRSKTAPEVVYRDLGYIPRHPVRFALTASRYQAYFDELIRTGVVFMHGDGIFAEYTTEAVEERMSRG